MEKKDDKKGGGGGKKEAKKDAKKGGKKEDGKGGAVEEDQVEPAKLIPKLVRRLYETPSQVQSYLEETLLSFPEDYGEEVQKFIDTW